MTNGDEVTGKILELYESFLKDSDGAGEMKVDLISYTPSPELICSVAGKTCYSSKTPKELFDTDNGSTKVLESIIESHHDSVLEHCLFTFAVSGVSRVLTHQLVRHRIASYEQQSERYVELQDLEIVIPDTCLVSDDVRDLMKIAGKVALIAYKKAIAEGASPEDARYILPQGITTNIVISMNGRELRHFLSLRMCNRAQEEIRTLAEKMLAEVKKVAPVIFKNAGPACVTGKCPEGSRSCGKPRVEFRDSE